jgi:hypothetical protein
MAFQLESVTEVKLLHVNHRKEFHGEEKVQAVDLNFEWETSNEKLDLLDPALRTALYWNAAADQGQEALPEVLAILPNLRVAHLNGGKFKYRGSDKFKGYDFALDYGLGDEDSNVEFADCAVGKFEIETKEGGTVTLRWQVSYAGERLTGPVMSKLIDHEQEKAFITLKAPATLVLVKGGKGKAPAAGGEDQEDLLGDEEGGDQDSDVDEDTPEKALKRANAVH